MLQLRAVLRGKHAILQVNVWPAFHPLMVPVQLGALAVLPRAGSAGRKRALSLQLLNAQELLQLGQRSHVPETLALLPVSIVIQYLKPAWLVLIRSMVIVLPGGLVAPPRVGSAGHKHV